MKMRSRNAPVYMALVLALLFAGKAFAAEGWSFVYRQCETAYPDDPGLRERLRQAEKAGAPSEEVSAILARSASAAVPARNLGAFIDRLSTAAGEGLPPRPFAEKVLEGLAKNVPPDLILPALDRQMEAYREAKRILRQASKGRAGENALDSVATAMQRGVSPQALRELYRNASSESAVIFHSAQAMADLKDLGFSESQGRRMVEAAVKAGYFTRGEPLFTAAVSQAQKSGLSNDEIADRMEDNLRRGYPLSRMFQPSNGISPAREGNTGMGSDAGGGWRTGPAGGLPNHGRMGGGRR